MRFLTDDDELSVSIELEDDDGPGLDLTRGQLGHRCLDYAVGGMLRSIAAQRAPDGSPWARNRLSTIAEKGFDAPGTRTGSMLMPTHWIAGPRNVDARSATWWLDAPQHGKEHGFHNGRPDTGQVPRKLVGWTDDAVQAATLLIRGDPAPEQQQEQEQAE